MVTAGVYMVARCHVLYQLAPVSLEVVAVIGAATALFAATIGLAQNDIKRVLAYSTVSQLGYMFFALRRRRVHGRHLPPHDPRVLQGAAVPRRGLGDPRALGRAGPARAWVASRPRLPWTHFTMLMATLAIAGSRRSPDSSARTRSWRRVRLRPLRRVGCGTGGRRC